MGKHLALVVAVVTGGGCASDEWRPRDTVSEVGFQVLNALDAYTTRRIRAHPDVEEVEPVTRAILGAKPEPTETVAYFAALGLAHYLISRALPPRWRTAWQTQTIAYTAIIVRRNCELGLCGGESGMMIKQLPTRVYCDGVPC